MTRKDIFEIRGEEDALTVVLINDLFQVLGPKLMENRKPFELRKVLIVYNAAQVIFSAWLFYEVI